MQLYQNIKQNKVTVNSLGILLQADLVAQRQSKEDPAEGLHRYLSEALSTTDVSYYQAACFLSLL